jgi:hypothetical protein
LYDGEREREREETHSFFLLDVMEFVRGRIFNDPNLKELKPSERSAVYDAMNEALAQLHCRREDEKTECDSKIDTDQTREAQTREAYRYRGTEETLRYLTSSPSRSLSLSLYSHRL